VVMRQVFLNEVAQVGFTEDDEMIEEEKMYH
jgi:hypothetical protein